LDEWGEDELEEVGKDSRIIGQGSCVGFDQGPLDQILSKLSQVLDKKPGLTHM